MLNKIRCNPIHPRFVFYLAVPYVPVRVTLGALVAHRYTYVPPRVRTSQYCRTFILLLVSVWNDLADPVFDSVGLAGFKKMANIFLLSKLHYLFLSSTIFPLIFFLSIGWYCGAVVLGLIGCRSLFHILALPTSFNNNNNNNNIINVDHKQ